MNINFPFEHFLKKSTNPDQKIHNIDSLLKVDEIETASEQLKEGFSEREISFFNSQLHEVLKKSLIEQKYNLFFNDKLSIYKITQDIIEFKVPTLFIKEIVEQEFKDKISEALTNIIGSKYEIKILCQDSEINNVETLKKDIKTSNPSFQLDLNPRKEDILNTIESKYIEHINDTNNRAMEIDVNKTFKNFIVGPSNNLAFAATHAVADSPGKSGKYPCLYIYSDSGLGKTHLLHAVANGIRESKPQLKICLISAREFMKELIEAYQEKNLEGFQTRYTEQVDVLMIDDIHELKNKQSTQEEFFHIFNELHAKGKQLIFTSDKAPDKINGIEERLITRLQWGLVLDIQRPDLETRIAILKKKAIELDLFVPDDVLTLIASSIKTSIREMEGALVKLDASTNIMKYEIDIDMAKDILKIGDEVDFNKITLESIAKATSNYLKIPVADLKSKSRNKDIVNARHMAWYLSKKLIDETFKDIAKYYGGRDHSSVIHGVNKVQERLKDDAKLSKDLIFIENNL